MAGNSDGARKGWEKRRSSTTPHKPRHVNLEKERVWLRDVNSVSRRFASGLNINLQRIEEEYVDALKNLQDRMDLYDRMSNDSDVKAQLRANIMPMLSSVRWKVEGGDTEARELVAANLLRQGPSKFWCDTSWVHRLNETLKFLKYGFTAFGKTREIVDGRMIFRTLKYLKPRSFKGTRGPWEFDDRGSRLVAVHRTYRLPSGETIQDERVEINDVAMFVWDLDGDNWEGQSMIRAGYKDWMMKDIAEKIAMVNLQNAGVAIPDAELAPGDGPKDRDNLRSIVESMRGGSKERQFIVRGAGQKVGFLTSQGGLDATPVIDSHRRGLSNIGSTQFLGLGNTESGSRASDSVHMVHYLQMADAVREVFQEQINHGAGNLQGLVEELVDANFDDVKEYPRIVGSRVSPTEQLDNIPLIGEQVQRGSLSHDLTLENHVRNSLGLPLLTQEQFDKACAARNIGGRPNEIGNIDRQDPRNDTEGRRFGLQNTGENLQQKNRPSWPWLKSTTV